MHIFLAINEILYVTFKSNFAKSFVNLIYKFMLVKADAYLSPLLFGKNLIFDLNILATCKML